jgi:hypothetical protein
MYAARATRRSTLPLRVFGSAATACTALGRVALPSRATIDASRRGSACSGSAPSISTTKQTSASPLASSGMPTAAASTTSGSSTSSDSISAGPTRFPASMIVSSERPSRNQCPSASR